MTVHILPPPDRISDAGDVTEAARILAAQIRMVRELGKLTAAGQMVAVSFIVAAIVIMIYPPDKRERAIDEIADLTKENLEPERLH